MTHDPRCPSLRYVVLGGRVCVCETIAQVRQDMLGKCIAAVEWSHDHNPEHAQGLWLALTELRALKEKP